MSHSFQLVGINHEPFQSLFGLTDNELQQHAAVRCHATGDFGFPCRITLEDASLGEELLLLPYLHQPGASPYRASGPIFVRRGVQQQKLAAGEIPPYVAMRLMSVRAYDAQHMMVEATVCEGTVVRKEIETFFQRQDVAYIHLHNAKRGCFSCRVERVATPLPT